MKQFIDNLSERTDVNIWLRLKNKATLMSFLGILIVVVYQVAQLFGVDIPADQKQVLDVCEGIITLLCIIGVVTDPTTDGVRDSELAKNYSEPRSSKTDPILAVKPIQGTDEVEIINELPAIEPLISEYNKQEN